MTTILTRMTTTVGENHCLDLHVPNIPIGEIEKTIYSARKFFALPDVSNDPSLFQLFDLCL
jgi:hypothetical protein